MKKKSLLLAVAGIMLATANAPTAEAYEVSGVGNSKLSSPPVSVSKALTDGRYNFRYFEVETSEGGNTTLNSGFCRPDSPTKAIRHSMYMLTTAM